MMIDHGVQPAGSQLRVAFSPLGVVISDGRQPASPGRAASISLKHGRVTITGLAEPAGPPCFLQNRHIRETHVLSSSPARLRIGMSDVCVDLFVGLSVAELEWAEQLLNSELQGHLLRKEAALVLEPIPDRWKFSGPKYPSWQDSKGMLLLAGLLLAVAGAFFCVRDISQTLATASGSALDPENIWRISLAGISLCAMLALIFEMIRGLFQWHDEAEKAHR